MNHRAILAFGLLAATCWVRPALAIPITFTPNPFMGSLGGLSAQVDFDQFGSNLIVRLTNTSTADVMVPSQVLTAVFFDIVGNPTLSSLSAVVATGSTVFFGPSDPGNVVGGEMAYKAGLVGAPGSASHGISSVGLGLFGPGERFPGNDLQSPESPNGLQYGLTSAGDDTTTGNTPVTGTNALIKNSVVYTLGGLPAGFMLSGISNVRFQYGTDLSEPSFPGTGGGTVDAPSSGILLGAGLIGMVWVRRRRVPPRRPGPRAA